MNRETAIQVINFWNSTTYKPAKLKEALDIAIEDMEKQIPKKVVNIDDFADYAECPSCGAIATDNLGCLYGWCRKCGQKLKRSKEE